MNGGMTGKDENINKVFAHKVGNSYSTAKKFTKAGNPNSIAQSLVRSTFAQTSANWSGLTENQRGLWNADAPNWVNTDVFGDKSQSGKNLFTGCNVALAVAELDQIDAPGNKNLVAEIGFSDLSKTGGVLSFETEFDAFGTSDKMQLAVSSQQTAGTSICKRKTVLVNYKCDANFDNDVTALYIAKYGAMVTGRKLFFEIRTVSQGGNVVKLKSGVITL